MGAKLARRMYGRRNNNQVQLDDIDSVDGAYYEHIDIVNSQRSLPDEPNSRNGAFIKRPAYPKQCSKHAFSLPDNSETKTSTKDGWKHTQETPTERVIFLLDAFMPMIVGCLNVVDIIPYFVLIEDPETLRQKHRESPREAVTFLIKQLKESDEPGKWQAFLEALKLAGYQYIARLLLEETEADHTINRRLLRLFTPELINGMNPEEFIDHLLADEVINDQDREEIQCEKRNRGDIAASLMLLERIPKRQENWFETFVRVLEKCGLEDLMNCFRVSELTRESTNECTTHPLSDSNHDYMSPKPDYITPTYGCVPTKCVLRSKRDALRAEVEAQKEVNNLQTDIGRLEFEFEILRKGCVPFNGQQSEIDRLRSKRDALRAEVEAQKEDNNLQTDIRTLEFELEILRKVDEKDYVKPDFPQEQQNGDPTTVSSSIPTSTTLFEKQSNNFTTQPNSGITPTSDSYEHTSTAKPDDRLDKIVNGIDNIGTLLKDIKCELKGKNEQKSSTTNRSTSLREVKIPSEYQIMPVPHKCERISYLRSMDSAISMGYISCNTEQYV